MVHSDSDTHVHTHAQMLRPGLAQRLFFKSHPPCYLRQHLSSALRAWPLGLAFYVRGGHSSPCECRGISLAPRSIISYSAFTFTTSRNIRYILYTTICTLSSNVYTQLVISEIESSWHYKEQLKNYKMIS